MSRASIATSEGASNVSGKALVVGTGQLSRIVADAFEEDHGPGSVLGFVAPPAPGGGAPADGRPPDNSCLHDRPIVSEDEAYARWRDMDVRILIGSDDRAASIPAWRRAVFHALRARGLPVSGFVHSAAWILGGAVVAPTAIILADAYVEPLVRIGRNAILEGDSFVSQNSSIGAHCHLETSALIAGQVAVQAEVTVGVNAILRSGVTLSRCSRVGCGAIVQRDLHLFEKVAVRPLAGNAF